MPHPRAVDWVDEDLENYAKGYAYATSRPNRHYPWDDLRLLYVEGERGEAKGSWHFPTLQEISVRHSLQPSKVRARAAREKWSEQREAFKVNLEDVRRNAVAEDALQAIIDTDDRALSTSRIGASLVFNRVREIEHEATTRAASKAEWERIRDTARAAAGLATSQGDDAEVARIKEESAAAMAEIDYDPWAPPVVDARELSTLAMAAGNWHTLALKALGEPETRRLEISGPGGGPMQVQAATIYQELTRDDPARLHSLMAAFGRAVLGTVEPPGPYALPSADDGSNQGDEPGGPA